jgi:predicted  nucleic acid-binding Zn-ribbon protein
MNRRTLLLVTALAIATTVLVPGGARAQGNSAGQTAPAGDAAAPAQTNSTTSANATTSTTATTPSAIAPAKKVWTNEDMKAVHTQNAISTFSTTNNKPANGKPAATAKSNKDAKQYQNEITRLQEKLPPLDEQIAQLQAALNGDTLNSTRHVGGAKIDDWHDELVRAQKQREDIVAKISALQDEARRNGVPPNLIPE